MLVLANTSHSCCNTPAVWMKWNGAHSRHVDFITGESQSSPAHVVCGRHCVRRAWRITTGLCHAFP